MAGEQNFDFFTTVDDEMYDDLAELAGQKIVHLEVWDESLQDTLDGTPTDPTTQVAVDMDLYLDGGVYFELYGVLCYPDPEQEPIVGFSTIQQQLAKLLKQELRLDEVAVDEDNALVFVLSRQHQPQIYLMIEGWSFSEWDELPSG